jgi:hypothetical protein
MADRSRRAPGVSGPLGMGQSVSTHPAGLYAPARGIL